MPVAAVAECAGLELSDVITTAHRPVLASVGNPFYIAEVTGAALSRANPEWAAFRKHIVRLPAPVGSSATRLSLYLYAKDGARIRTRMFAPLAGIVEDPATGSAATPLGALLLSLSGEARPTTTSCRAWRWDGRAACTSRRARARTGFERAWVAGA